MKKDSGEEHHLPEQTGFPLHDRKIISLLQKNARIPANQIGREVHLSKAAIGYRIRNLENNQVIRKYITQINFMPYGYHYTLVHVTHRSNDREERFFIERMKEEYVLFTAYTLSSPRGLLIGIIHDQPLSVAHLEKRASSLLKYSRVELEAIESLQLPALDYAKAKMEIIKHAHLNRHTRKERVPTSDFPIDAKRIRLLSILSQDARISVVELANRAGMHPVTVRTLMKEMTSNGTIIRFVPSLNPHLFGNTFLVVMRGQSPNSETREKLLGFISTKEISDGVARLKEKGKFLATMYFPKSIDYFALETDILRDFPDSTFDIQLIREQVELDWFPHSLEKKLLAKLKN